MRVIFILLGVVIVLAWLGFEIRESRPEWSKALFIIAGFFGLLLGGAYFGLYGT